VAAWYIRN